MTFSIAQYFWFIFRYHFRHYFGALATQLLSLNKRKSFSLQLSFSSEIIESFSLISFCSHFTRAIKWNVMLNEDERKRRSICIKLLRLLNTKEEKLKNFSFVLHCLLFVVVAWKFSEKNSIFWLIFSKHSFDVIGIKFLNKKLKLKK